MYTQITPLYSVLLYTALRTARHVGPSISLFCTPTIYKFNLIPSCTPAGKQINDPVAVVFWLKIHLKHVSVISFSYMFNIQLKAFQKNHIMTQFSVTVISEEGS